MYTLRKLLISTLTLFCVAPNIEKVQASVAKVQHIINSNSANQNQQPSSNRSITKSVVENYRLDNDESSYEVNADYTYTKTISSRTTLLTRLGIENNQSYSLDYYPDSQSLDLLEAYVIQPDGTKINVTKENVLTNTSGQLQNKTDSNKIVTMSVTFPKLTVGSQVFVKWKITQKKTPGISFHNYYTPLFDEPTVNSTVRISLPAKLKLRWQQRGGYKVTDEIKGSRRIITATIKNQVGHQPENSMVNPIDISPLFIFSNLDNWEQIGAIYSKQSRDKILVTPEIKALALHITGNKQGIEAARAIYNWVAQNIQYVQIYLNESAGYVPNSSSDVLQNGYGDCKDHVVLMQALLKAKGIDA